MDKRESSHWQHSIPGGMHPKDIWLFLHDTSMRFGDTPGDIVLGRALMRDPTNPYFQNLFMHRIYDKANRRLAAIGDSFYAYLPSPHSVSPIPPRKGIGVGFTSNRILAWISEIAVNAHLGVFGPNGSGKTMFTMMLVLQLLFLGMRGSVVLVFDLKRTWRNLLTLPYPWLQNKVFVFSADDFMHAFLEPPRGVPVNKWANISNHILAQSYKIVSAQRLLREILQRLYDAMQPGRWPTLSEAEEAIRAFRPSHGTREAEYRESVLWMLCDIRNHFGNALTNYRSSNFFEKMFTPPAIHVVEVGDLPPIHVSFLINTVIEWITYFRDYNPLSKNFNVVIVIEDGTAVLDARNDLDAPGGVSLLSQAMVLSRERLVSTISVGHRLTSMSQTVLSNTESRFACCLRGEDEVLVQRFFGTTPEQTRALRTFKPGQCLAYIPSFWNHPIPVFFPRLPLQSCDDDTAQAPAQLFLTGVHPQ
ncbi:MAG: hypothetical protein V1809_03915 [Planctomycetota bacterium]